jgi:single-strand DNA-binding protein
MVNKVILIGRTGKDPEITTLKDGSKVARLTLATTEIYKDKNGNKAENTEWHNLSMWQGRAEFAEKYISKGQLLYVEGKLHYSNFEKDGVKHYRTEIVVDSIKMLVGKSTEQSKTTPDTNAPIVSEGDDLPF